MSDSSQALHPPSELPAHRRPDRELSDIRLLPVQRWVMLVGLVSIFLFGGKHPVWHNPFDIDRGIWLSYAPIPILVLICLAWSRRLSLLTWTFNTAEIIGLKFSITYLIAIPLWATTAYEPSDRIEPPRSTAPASPPPPAVTPWPDDERGTIRATVTNAQTGAPVAGALVYVAAGFEDIVFPRPDEAVGLTIDDGRFAEPMSVVQRWQPLKAQADDGRLHPLRLSFGDDVQLVTSVLADAPTTPIRTAGLSGILSVRCVLHGETSHLVVLDHPFHALTDAAGEAVLADVPALSLRLAVWHAGDRDETPVRLASGTTVSVPLRLTGGQPSSAN